MLTVSTHKRTNKLRRLWLPLVIAIFGGLLSSVAYPNNSIWIAIFPSVALIVFGITTVTFRASWFVGFFAGLAFYAAQIPWMTAYLGPIPWLALSSLEALIFSLGAAAINLLWQLPKRGVKLSPVLLALGVASTWTAREWLACNFPYGGFPWSRLALSQANSPLKNWVFWGGNSLLSFVIVFFVALLMLGWKSLLKPSFWGSSPAALLLVSVFLVPLATQISITAESGVLNVAAVQGNAKAGLFANSIPGTILQNHLDASKPLIEEPNRPDLVIWPENAADQNPLANQDAKWKIANFTNGINTPLLFGTITERGGDVFNSSILWLPRVGAVDWYDKKRPVPFGEYVPDRAFFRLLAPDLIDLIPRGYSFGTKDGIFEIPTANRNTAKLGTMICFEVAVDNISADLVRQGAKIIAIQTNNSDFGTTNESSQQLAIARLRAIETGRAVINISTVGISAIILPDGQIVDELPSYHAGIMQESLPLRDTLTPAMFIGSNFDLINNFSAIAQVLLLFWVFKRKQRILG